jgi:Na+-translocating ferredoxin:NAD+ oxidoreductase RnfD subunit
MVIYLAALFIYAEFSFTNPVNLWKGFLIVILYAAFDLGWTYIRDRVWYFPLSSWISAYVLAIVSLADPNIFQIFLLPFLAVFSKQLLHFGKMRHVFNPAGFGMAITSLFFPTITWWATGWNTTALIIILLISIFIWWKQERWHVVISFLLSYVFLLTLFLLANGIAFDNLPQILQAYLLNGTVLFFMGVMLIEPLTSSFSTKKQRIFYALFVSLFTILAMILLKFTGLRSQDPLSLGLIFGNIAASLLFLPKFKKGIIAPEQKK